MPLEIGPRALRPVAGYSPDWAPGGLPPSAPRGPGVVRVLVVVVAAVLLGSAFLSGPGPVAADEFAGSPVTCTTQAHTLTSFSTTGWAGARIRYRLVIPSGGTVVGRWINSDGWVGVSDAFSAGASGSGTWWVDGNGHLDENNQEQINGRYLSVDFNPNGSRISYVVTKAGSYGGCFTVDSVVVTRFPAIVGSPANADPSSQPSQSAAPPSAPPGSYGCSGTTIDTCDEPPAGWCWVGRFVEAGDAQLAPCDDASDQGLVGTGGDPSEPTVFTCTTTWQGYGEFCNTGSVGVTAGDVWHIEWSWSGGDGGWTNQHLEGSSAWSAYPMAEGRSGSADYTFSGTIASVWFRVNALGYEHETFTANVWINGTTIPDADGDGWSDAEEQACGSDPEDENDGCPGGVPPPSGWPSAPPAAPGEGGGPVDQCEGPDDGALPMCAGFTFPPFPSFPTSFSFDVCPSESSDLVICQTVAPSGSLVAGNGLGEVLPSASDLLDRLSGKALFSVIDAARDGLTEASASAGAMPDLCTEFTLGVLGTLEFCIPEWPFEAVADWRWLGVALIWLAGLVTLWRIANSALPGSSPP